MPRIALATYHSIAEHDDLKLLHGLGYEVASLGAYLVPSEPGDDKRPPLDIPPPPPAVVKACRDTHAAKQAYPPALLKWLGPDGVLISHHFPETTIFAQWDRLRKWGGRVIWRSCGQNSGMLERAAQWFRAQGMERVSGK